MAEKKTVNIPLTHQGVRNLDVVPGNILPISGGHPATATTAEQWLSATAGATLALAGLSRRGPLGYLLAGLGGLLFWRGVSGTCPVCQTREYAYFGRSPESESGR